MLDPTTPETVALRHAITASAALALHLVGEVQKEDPLLALKMLQQCQLGEFFAVTVVFAPAQTRIELAVRDGQGGSREVGHLDVEYQRPS